MNAALRLADVLGEVRRKSDDIVIGRLLDLAYALDREGGDQPGVVLRRSDRAGSLRVRKEITEPKRFWGVDRSCLTKSIPKVISTSIPIVPAQALRRA